MRAGVLNEVSIEEELEASSRGPLGPWVRLLCQFFRFGFFFCLLTILRAVALVGHSVHVDALVGHSIHVIALVGHSTNRGKKHSALADGAPLIKNKKGEFAPDLHAQAIAKKAIAAHKKNSAQADESLASRM